MLILTRRIGESLVINNNVNVTVLGVKGNQVRIGVRAPDSVPVHREEIFRRIQQEIDSGNQNDEVVANLPGNQEVVVEELESVVDD